MRSTKQLRILIMGLPGSGKTTLARQLNLALPTSHMINADDVRERANDWDFSHEGRIRQAERIRSIADQCENDIVIADFVAGVSSQRDVFRPHILVWMNTIKAGRYEDTNKAFTEPIICKIRFDSFNEVNVDRVVNAINEKKKEYEK